MYSHTQKNINDIKKIQNNYLYWLDTQIENNKKTAEEYKAILETGQPLQQNRDNRSNYEKMLNIQETKNKLYVLLQKITDATTAREIITSLTNNDINFVYSNSAYIIDQLYKKYGNFTTMAGFNGFIENYKKSLINVNGMPTDTNLRTNLDVYKIDNSIIDEIIKNLNNGRNINNGTIITQCIDALKNFMNVSLNNIDINNLVRIDTMTQQYVITLLNTIINKLPNNNDLKKYNKELYEANIENNEAKFNNAVYALLNIVGDMAVINVLKDINDIIKNYRPVGDAENIPDGVRNRYSRGRFDDLNEDADIINNNLAEIINPTYQLGTRLMYNGANPYSINRSPFMNTIVPIFKKENLDLLFDNPITNKAGLLTEREYITPELLAELKRGNEIKQSIKINKNLDKQMKNEFEKMTLLSKQKPEPKPSQYIKIKVKKDKKQPLLLTSQQYVDEQDEKIMKKTIEDIMEGYNKITEEEQQELINIINFVHAYPQIYTPFYANYVQQMIEREMRKRNPFSSSFYDKLDSAVFNNLSRDQPGARLEPHIINEYYKQFKNEQGITGKGIKKNTILDKDIRRYTILKGIIMAGNDNKALFTEFKKLMLKLSKKGLLNKKEVNDFIKKIK